VALDDPVNQESSLGLPDFGVRLEEISARETIGLYFSKVLLDVTGELSSRVRGTHIGEVTGQVKLACIVGGGIIPECQQSGMVRVHSKVNIGE